MPKRDGRPILVCQQFLTESHIVNRFANERASFLNTNDINDIEFFGTSDCYHHCFNSVSVNSNGLDSFETYFLIFLFLYVFFDFIVYLGLWLFI
jgi:hypothetical protein